MTVLPLTFRSLNVWDLTPAEAIAEQRRLRPEVVATDRLGEVRRVAGVDVGYEDDGAVTRAAVSVLDYPSLVLLESAIVRVPTRFPYIPGLLSFREAPAVLEALQKLAVLPDLLLYDGHGLAHPRRFGIACHVGLAAEIPTIGVAKSRLTGEYAPVPRARGSWSPLIHEGETVGAVLRTREAVSPVFVSIGHRVSLKTAIRYTLACAPRYRLPETTRQAHRLASHPPAGDGSRRMR